MNFKRIYLFLSLLLLIVFFANATEVNAMDTGFSTEEISEEKKTAFVSNINVSLLREEPEKSGILCFDVNEQGMIAVGNKDFQSKKICIYTSQGEFLYGYAFNCSQSFGVEWNGQNTNIYFVRSNVIISLDSEGNILDVKAIKASIDNNSYSNSLLYSTKRTVGNTTYLIRNDMGILNWIAFSFSQIVAVDAAGTESVIYDVNSVQLAKMIVAVSFICAFVFVAVAVIVRSFIKLRRGN